ncbi:MAG: hypothetical protein KDI04_02735 [Halieaceae bacterium]|nr:hypothetical protein [Halieaceae bacterium]
MTSDSREKNQGDPAECATDGDSFEARVARALTPNGNCNTNKKADEIRQLLESPAGRGNKHLAGLEDSWRLLEPVYEDRYYVHGEGNPAVVREINTAETPITDFTNCVAQGFYPPPEIMLILQICFEKYLTAGGDASLDEAVFGVRHKKRGSYAYSLTNGKEYAFFHELLKEKENAGQPVESMGNDDLAEQYLESPLSRIWGDADTDAATFVRGYFRWKSSSGEKP